MMANRQDRRVARRQIDELSERAKAVRAKLFAGAEALAEVVAAITESSSDALRVSAGALKHDVRAGIESYVDALGQLHDVGGAKVANLVDDAPLCELLAANRWCGATTAAQAKDRLVEEVATRSVGRSDLALLLSSVDHVAYRLCATMPEPFKVMRGAELVDGIAQRLLGEEFDKTLAADPRWAVMRERWVKLGWRSSNADTFSATFVRAAAERAAEIHDARASGSPVVDTVLDDLIRLVLPKVRKRMMEAFAARLSREWEEVLRVRAARVAGDATDGADVVGSCPFCGGSVSARWGDPPGDPGSLLHALPTCPQYDAMTADEFVRAVVAKSEERDGDSLPRELPDGSVEIDVPLDRDEAKRLSVLADRWGTTREGVLERIVKERVQQLAPPTVTPADAWAAGQSGTGPGRPALAYSDHVMMRVGRTLWEVTYARGWSDEQVRDEMLSALAKENESDRWYHPFWPDPLMVFAAKWAVHAFQRLMTSHTFAAALMCSDAQQDVLGGIEEHWDAFLVLVPNGMLVADEFEFSRVLVASYSFGAQMILLTGGGPALVLPQPRIVVSEAPTLADLLTSEEADLVAESPTQRCVVMAKRLVAGLLLNLQHPPNFKVKKVEARPRSKGREAEPEHRIVTIGSPIEIDCREQVKEYIQHGRAGRKHGPPTVQVLVRGHYRRQVCGVGRMERKVLWIHPHYRGPEAALIQTRGKQVKGSP